MFKEFEHCCKHVTENSALNALSQITREAEKLTEINDIIDELDIILQLLRDQTSLFEEWKDPDPIVKEDNKWSKKMRGLLNHIYYVDDVVKIRKLATRTQEAASIIRFISPHGIFLVMLTNNITINSSTIFLISSKNRPTPPSPAQHENRERIQQDKAKRF